MTREYAGTVAYAYIRAQVSLLRIKQLTAQMSEKEKSAVSEELFKQLARKGGDERAVGKTEGNK